MARVGEGSPWWGAENRARAGRSALPVGGVAEVLETRRLPASLVVSPPDLGAPDGSGKAPASAGVSALAVSAPADGPRVVSVQRYGFHREPTTLVVTFNGPLSAPFAENVYNYQITGPAGATILVQSAEYSAATNSVSLQTVLSLKIRERYTLTIFGTGYGGVRGASGEPLDGAGTGSPGTNYVATIDASNLGVADLSAPGAEEALRIVARVREADSAHALHPPVAV